MSKKAIIIGATSGIGNALARKMSAEGYILGITGRRRNLLDELHRALPGESYCSDFDVSELDTAIKSLKDLIEEMGGVDIIVINAGVGESNNKDLYWEKELLTIDVNVRGFSAMANVAFDYFKMSGQEGHIVGISSILSLEGSGTAPAYSASKSFVSAYLNCLQKRVIQLNLPITITDIKPGFVKTPMTQNATRMFWVSSADKAATQILKAIRNQASHAYVTKRWTLIGWLMKILPNFFFTKM